MPWEFQVDEDFLRLTFTGVLTRADLDASLERLGAHEGSLPVVPHRLTDISGVTDFNIGSGTRATAVSVRRAGPFPNAFKSAFVVRTQLQYGFVRMYQTLVAHPQIIMGLFSDEDSARRWLAESSMSPVDMVDTTRTGSAPRITKGDTES